MATDRSYILDKMKGRTMRIEDFDYERLQAPPLYSLLSVDDVAQLHKLATSIRYAGKPIERMQAIDQIMRNRGFRKFAGGTNRAVYKFLEDNSFVLKVATDAAGVEDSPREYINQHHIKPFCCKIFEVSQCGTVAVCERLKPITSREEFLSVADEAYMLISQWLTGEYVMDDIGTQYFMNYGFRITDTFRGICILDYPYSFKLDGNKLYCNTQNEDGSLCGGVIDYDDGYNHLYCTKCGKRYRAQELAESIKTDKVIIKGGQTKMKVSFGYGDDARVINDSDWYSDVKPKMVGRKKGKKARIGTLKVQVGKGDEVIDVDNYNHPEEKETVKAEVLRGTIVHAKETENDEFKDEGEMITGEDLGGTIETEEVAVAEMIPPENITESRMITTDDLKAGRYTIRQDYLDKVCAEVISSTDLDSTIEEKTKWLILTNEDGSPYERVDYVNTVITHIMGRPVADISIITKEAYTKLVDEISDLKDKVSDTSIESEFVQTSNEVLLKENKKLQNDILNLKDDIKELNETIAKNIEDYDKLQNDYDELEKENEKNVKDYNDLVDMYDTSENNLEAITEKLKMLQESYNELLLVFSGKNSNEPKAVEAPEEDEDDDIEPEGDDGDYFDEPHFNVGSPLLRQEEETPEETEARLKDEIEDKNILKRLDEVLPTGAAAPITNPGKN